MTNDNEPGWEMQQQNEERRLLEEMEADHERWLAEMKRLRDHFQARDKWTKEQEECLYK